VADVSGIAVGNPERLQPDYAIAACPISLHGLFAGDGKIEPRLSLGNKGPGVWMRNGYVL